VSTQLRLVDTATVPSARRSPSTTRAPSRASTRARANAGKATGSRRAVSWGDWRLDARTRRVGRAGVAQARQALEAAARAEELSQAS